MADILKKVTIAGTGASRDIGAEAQNVEVSYDSAGNIILDVDAAGISVDHTKTIPEVLQDTPQKKHTSATSEYGAASRTEYGHVKIGQGLNVTDGEISIAFGNSSTTVTRGNDPRLDNDRKNPNPVTFSNGDTSVDYDGSVGRTITNETVGAAPTNHSDSTSKYGIATKDKYGHVRLGEGVEDRGGSLSLSIATENSLGGVKVDGDTITIDADGTLHGGGSGGSTIEIYTTEPTLYGQKVTLTAASGSEVVETEFDATGYAAVRGYMGTGSVVISSTSAASQTASGSMNIPYFGNYALTLAFWSAPVTIVTPTADMYGQRIVVKKDGLEVGSTSFDGAGYAEYVAHTPGTYTFECTLGWKTFSKDATISAEQSYSVTIQGFVANITVMTTTPEFAGATVTVTGDGIPTSNIVLGSDNTAVYKAYQTGDYTFTITYNGERYSKNALVSSQSDISVAINLWTAIAEIETRDFANELCVIETKDGNYVDTVRFDTDGKITYRIHKPDTYVFTVDDGE